MVNRSTPTRRYPGKPVVLLALAILLNACAGGRIKGGTYDSRFIPQGKEPEIRVRVSGGGILEIPMETYLAGVIGHEMSPRWPPEALKAQAVAARSYALYQRMLARLKRQRWDVADSQADQVFRESGTRDAYLRALVEKTRGEVLWSRDRLVQAFYSSTCGGVTESAAGAGLAVDSPLTDSCKDDFCSISPFRTWSHAIGTKEIETRLRRAGFRVNNLASIKVTQRNPSGYANEIEYADARGKTTLAAKRFRNLANNMRVKSLNFEIFRDGKGVYHFTGHGFGHGVGLCQYGAKGMADSAKDYRAILTQYYRKAKLRKLY